MLIDRIIPCGETGAQIIRLPYRDMDIDFLKRRHPSFTARRLCRPGIGKYEASSILNPFIEHCSTAGHCAIMVCTVRCRFHTLLIQSLGTLSATTHHPQLFRSLLQVHSSFQCPLQANTPSSQATCSSPPPQTPTKAPPTPGPVSKTLTQPAYSNPCSMGVPQTPTTLPTNGTWRPAGVAPIPISLGDPEDSMP